LGVPGECIGAENSLALDDGAVGSYFEFEAAFDTQSLFDAGLFAGPVGEPAEENDDMKTPLRGEE